MLDRLTPPPFNRNTSFELLKPISTTLPGGANVQFVAGGAQDVIRIELIFAAGRWFEQTTGASHFTSTLLSKGTQQKDSFEIARIFDLYGAHLEVSPGLDVVSISLYTPLKTLASVISLFHEIITTPAFPDKELRQSKSIFLQNLKINNEKTSFVASRLLRKNLFGGSHPYGKELDEQDVNAVEREQLLRFHQEFFQRVQIFVSGKVNTDVQELICKTFSEFGGLQRPTQTEVTSITEASPTYLEKTNGVQTSIRLGKKSLVRSHADYFDVVFLNHILGGYFGSRLMKNIREEKGLSYGIYSSLQPMKNDSFVSIGADVNKENRSLATTEIKAELNKLCQEKIVAEEIDTARFHFIGSLQSEIATSFAHAEKLRSLLLNNLPSDYYQKMIDRVNVITDEELRATAQKYFAPESFIEVAVG